MWRHPIPIKLLLGLLVCLASTVALGTEGTDGFRAKMEKWVEARTLISKERADWLVEKQYLEATRDLLRREREALRAELAELEESHTDADSERRELVLQRGDHQRTAQVLEADVAELEAQLLALVPALPKPFQQRLEVLLVQIPEDPETTKVPLGQRMMNVLGVLAQAEKWNGTATLVGETRAVGGDQKVQVRTLYWGLGEAIYADSQGRSAGVGRPTDEGWVFEDDPDLVERAALLLDIYEGNVDTIEFIPIPVEIQ